MTTQALLRAESASQNIPSAALAVDFSEACRFLELLDPEAGDFLFGARDDDKHRVKALIARAKAEGKPKPLTWHSRRGTILSKAHRTWITGRQAEGWGISVAVQAMKGERRRIDELAYIRALYGEMDISEPLKPWPIEPSILVETSPGRFHAYWLALPDDPISDLEFQGCMECIVETHGSDPDAKDLARAMRLPGTWNLKPERPPHLVRIVSDSGARYSREQFLAAFPPPIRSTKPAGPRPVFNGHAPPGLERFHEPLQHIDADRYGDCIVVGMALHHESGGSADGLLLWEQWCAKSQHWSSGWCESKWPTFGKRTGVTGGKIIHLAQEHGYSPPLRPWRKPTIVAAAKPRIGRAEQESQTEPTRADAPVWPEWNVDRKGAKTSPRARSQANISAFLEWKGVTLSYNSFTSRALATIDGHQRVVDDDLLRGLWLEADSHGLPAVETFFASVLLNEAQRAPFHPVTEYLDGLEHDGKPRLDTWLTEFLGVPDTPLTRAFAAKHLIAAVRRVRSPGTKHDAMLVFEGPQGAGKSTAIRVLGYDDWYSDALAVGEESRTVIELTSGVWLAEIAELKGLGSREAEQVKAMLSRQSDRARLAYGRMMTDRPRQFVIFGSVNDSQYLRDASGNRRFWPVRCGKIDIEALRAARDQIWAEAARREAQGETIALPQELWEAAAAEQEQRVQVDPWQPIIEPWLEGKTGLVEIAAINAKLGLEPKHQNGQVGQRIAAIMRRIGFVRVQRRRLKVRVYAYARLVEGEADAWIE